MVNRKKIGRELRSNRITIMLSDKELNAIDKYCKKYRIASRSTLLRQATLQHVMGRLLDDYPSLF